MNFDAYLFFTISTPSDLLSRIQDCGKIRSRMHSETEQAEEVLPWPEIYHSTPMRTSDRKEVYKYDITGQFDFNGSETGQYSDG